MPQNSEDKKTVYQILQELQDAGTFKILYQTGMFNPRSIFYYDIYVQYNKRKVLNKGKKPNVTLLAGHLGVHRSTVYRAIEVMEKT